MRGKPGLLLGGLLDLLPIEATLEAKAALFHVAEAILALESRRA